MIPNIFVSSTILDLQHLRDALRETVSELGYNPIMSDYGDIGYLHDKEVKDSCYSSLKNCQLSVLIIGKRYGTLTENNLSVTHNEYLTAKEAEVPLITLVDSDVLTYKEVYDANKKNDALFPGMDSPSKTFKFLEEITESNLNNGILPFSNATEARNHFKNQLAHLFGDLLRKRFDPLDSQMKDVLSEIKTLRHELVKDPKQETMKYLKATRFVLSNSDNKDTFRRFLVGTLGNLDIAIPELMTASSFDDFVENMDIELSISENVNPLEDEMGEALSASYFTIGNNLTAGNTGSFAIFKNKKVRMNQAAKDWFDNTHHEFREHIDN